MSVTVRDERLSLAVAALIEEYEVDLGDVSDWMCVEMENINGLVVGDLVEVGRLTLEIEVEDNTLTYEELVRLLLECVDSMRDSLEGESLI